MRIINVIETNTDNIIVGIDSFGVFEEQLSQEVIEQAEDNFKAKAIENGAKGEDINDHIENGYYIRQDGYAVSLVWSNV